MRKIDLVHLHELGLEVSKFIADNQDLDFDVVFEDYEDIEVSGPYDVQAQKPEQKDAVFALFGDLASATLRNEAEAGDDADTNAPVSSA